MQWHDVSNQQQSQRGSMMVLLMIIVVVGTIIAATSVLLVVDATVMTTVQSSGSTARDIAESGAENAILMLLRNPSYTGESLALNGGTATISVTGADPVQITSIGEIGAYRRTVYVALTRNQGRWEVVEWYEIN